MNCDAGKTKIWSNHPFSDIDYWILIHSQVRNLTSHLSNEKPGPWLFTVYRGWNPTQLYGDHNKPLYGGLFVSMIWTCIYLGKPKFFIFSGSKNYFGGIEPFMFHSFGVQRYRFKCTIYIYYTRDLYPGEALPTSSRSTSTINWLRTTFSIFPRKQTQKTHASSLKINAPSIMYLPITMFQIKFDLFIQFEPTITRKKDLKNRKPSIYGPASPGTHHNHGYGSVWYPPMAPWNPFGQKSPLLQRLCARLDAVDFKLTAALASGTPWASLEVLQGEGS